MFSVLQLATVLLGTVGSVTAAPVELNSRGMCILLFITLVNIFVGPG
jgi:hypothetical protein